ncbi:MAG TPA: phosphoribosylglycinamide formyltransferase [Segetibacter sp.]
MTIFRSDFLLHLYTMYHHISTNTSNTRHTKIAIFASGAGSNAKKIIEYLQDKREMSVALIVCNKPAAGVIQIARANNIQVLIIEREQFFRGDGYMGELEKASISFIVLAGFLWKIPEILIQNFRNRIINIHPALLPKYGGKGMYGANVHEAVIAAGEKESGITVHIVDGHYDNGDVIFQATCPVLAGDTAATLAERIHQLEHENFPKVVEEYVKTLS